jgi:hypothetical protein
MEWCSFDAGPAVAGPLRGDPNVSAVPGPEQCESGAEAGVGGTFRPGTRTSDDGQEMRNQSLGAYFAPSSPRVAVNHRQGTF